MSENNTMGSNSKEKKVLRNTEDTDNGKFLNMRYVVLGLLGFALFIILIATSIILIKNYLPTEYSDLSSIVPIIETMITSLLAYLYNRGKEQNAAKKQKEAEENLILYKGKIESCQNFLKILEEIIHDNVIRVAKTKDTSLEKEELKKLFFAISTLRIFLKEEAVRKILVQCTEISDVVKKFNIEPKDEQIIKSAYIEFMEALFNISRIFKEALQPYTPQSNREQFEFATGVRQNLDDLLGTLLGEKVESPKDNKWHVNIGEEKGIESENQYRCWDDMSNFNFWSAGGGKRYADGVQKLNENDTIYAYISGKGYVARGTVKSKAILVKEFFKELGLDSKEKREEKSKTLKSKVFERHLDDPEFQEFHNIDIGEYAVKVKWEVTEDKKPIKNPIFKISPLTICAMNTDNGAILDKIKWVPSIEK